MRDSRSAAGAPLLPSNPFLEYTDTSLDPGPDSTAVPGPTGLTLQHSWGVFSIPQKSTPHVHWP